MTAHNKSLVKSWNIGRFVLSFPALSVLNRQTQQLDGIAVSFEPSTGQSLKQVLDKRVSEIAKDHRSPLIVRYEWTSNTGGVLHVMDISDPTYYGLDGRRLLPAETISADTDGDKSKTELMQQIVRTTLNNYVPNDFAPASSERFGVPSGSIHKNFGLAEDVHAELTLSATGTLLEFDSEVVAQPVTIDLFEREAGTIAEAVASGLTITVLRKTHRKVNGQDGLELVDSAVSRGVRQYDARFEASGTANSPTQPYLIIHFSTDGRLEKGVEEKQFLELWDLICDGVKAAP